VGGCSFVAANPTSNCRVICQTLWPCALLDPASDRSHLGEIATRTRSSHSLSFQYGAMPEPATYEIVLRGHPSTRLLRPLLDDFTIDHSTDVVTRLVGDICDPAHLHGIVAHLTSVNLEIISIVPAPAQPKKELT
jgi:hypothetical protein